MHAKKNVNVYEKMKKNYFQGWSLTCFSGNWAKMNCSDVTVIEKKGNMKSLAGEKLQSFFRDTLGIVRIYFFPIYCLVYKHWFEQFPHMVRPCQRYVMLHQKLGKFHFRRNGCKLQGCVFRFRLCGKCGQFWLRL